MLIVCILLPLLGGALLPLGRFPERSRLRGVLTEAVVCLTSVLIAVALIRGELVLVCGMLTCERSNREIMAAIEPAMMAFPPASRVSAIVRFGHALPRTAAGDLERWKIQEELDHGNC